MLFPLSIYSIDREIFAGKAALLTLPGKNGQIGVLAGHAPLIALLKEGDIVIEKEDRQQQNLPIAGGVLEVSKHEVVVLVNF